MDQPKTRLTISSHNVNGFSRSKDFIYSQCENVPDSIRAIQEHWLAPPYKKTQGVNRLRSLHPAFDGFGNSAMELESRSKVRLGRPYGGTGFLYNKKYSSCIKPLVKYKHDRVSVLKLISSSFEIILINGYLPFYNTRDLQCQKAIYQDTLAYIENVMNDHPYAKVILLLDMNCNVYNTSHPYSILLRDLMTNYSLISSFDLMPSFNMNVDFTRSDPKTNSFTLIDGILISKSLTSVVTDVRIIDSGENVSDHRPVEIVLDLSLNEVPAHTVKPEPYVNWTKLSSDSIELYRDKMLSKLDEIAVPFYSLLHGDACCSDFSHKCAIQSYYRAIVDAVLCADSFLPRVSPGFQKPFWSPSLNDYKQKSIDCVKLWRANGCPKSGPLYKCKVDCTFQYKRAIQSAKQLHEKGVKEKLHDNLLNHDNDSFWREWRNFNKDNDSTVTRIDGETSDIGIAEAFRVYFCSVYSNSNSPSHEKLKTQFADKFCAYYEEHIADSISQYYLSWSDMEDIVRKLKIGKSSSGPIRPEHLFHGHTKLLLHLHLLFNAMIQHGIVVDDFLFGCITPIVKDSQGDIFSSANYRGITLGGLFSKLFEFALDKKISSYLWTDPLQFGFKGQTSTSHALFTLRSTIDRFNKRGSDVFVAFLDCTKAFDRISHHGLFIRLMERKVPLCLLLLIICWHIGMRCKVKWGRRESALFDVPLGTKQGGISSPGFFSLYVNEIISILRKRGLGCHLVNVFIGCILFADDLTLLAPTRAALQCMINAVSDFLDLNCLQLNVKKSKVMVFGKSYSDEYLMPLTLNAEAIEYVKEWRYLGVTIKSGRNLGFAARPDLSSFYRATNAILGTLKGAHEHVLLNLLYSNCVPIITYACAVKDFSNSDMSDCNLAMNNAFRKIFGFTRWQSIRVLREMFGFKSLYVIFKEAQDKFRITCLSHHNPIVKFIANHFVE